MRIPTESLSIARTIKRAVERLTGGTDTKLNQVPSSGEPMQYAGLVEFKDSNEPHLGGNILQGDAFTFCPLVWNYVAKRFCVQSVLDLGSGIGNAAHYFHGLGLKVVAIEGALANVRKSFYPAVCHDLTNGPVRSKVDLVHCQEVVEHIDPKYLDNLLDSLACGRVVLMTHALPGDGGHHHVNEQPTDYWVKHMASRGYVFLEEDSQRIRNLAEADGAVFMARTGLLFAKSTPD